MLKAFMYKWKYKNLISKQIKRNKNKQPYLIQIIRWMGKLMNFSHKTKNQVYWFMEMQGREKVWLQGKSKNIYGNSIKDNVKTNYGLI